MTLHEPWWERAACRDADPDIFLPPYLRGQRNFRYNNYGRAGTPAENIIYAQASALCAECPVRKKCLDDVLSMDGEVVAFQGGLSPGQIQDLRNRRRRGRP